MKYGKIEQLKNIVRMLNAKVWLHTTGPTDRARRNRKAAAENIQDLKNPFNNPIPNPLPEIPDPTPEDPTHTKTPTPDEYKDYITGQEIASLTGSLNTIIKAVEDGTIDLQAAEQDFNKIRGVLMKVLHTTRTLPNKLVSRIPVENVPPPKEWIDQTGAYNRETYSVGPNQTLLVKWEKTRKKPKGFNENAPDYRKKGQKVV